MREPSITTRLLPHVATALAGSGFEARRRWSQAVVILRREEKRVTSRADFGQWLAANDLRDQARECASRHVAPGCILVWLEVDVAEVALTGFLVFDLASALTGAARGA